MRMGCFTFAGEGSSMRSAFFYTIIAVLALSLNACAHDNEERILADNPAALSSSMISSSSGSYAMAVTPQNSGNGYVRQNDCADGVNDIITHLELLMAQNKNVAE
jgi:hypothetical protein